MIFEKIINWFKKIFHKEVVLSFPSNKQCSDAVSVIQVSNSNVEGTIQDDLQPYEINSFENYYLDKEEFFDLYSNIKVGSIDIEELSTDELIEFNMMAEKEIEIKSQKLEEKQEENEALKQELELLKQKEETLKSRVNN